jgi:hypothetical protein
MHIKYRLVQGRLIILSTDFNRTENLVKLRSGNYDRRGFTVSLHSSKMTLEYLFVTQLEMQLVSFPKRSLCG